MFKDYYIYGLLYLWIIMSKLMLVSVQLVNRLLTKVKNYSGIKNLELELFKGLLSYNLVVSGNIPIDIFEVA